MATLRELQKIPIFVKFVAERKIVKRIVVFDPGQTGYMMIDGDLIAHFRFYLSNALQWREEAACELAPKWGIERRKSRERSERRKAWGGGGGREGEGERGKAYDTSRLPSSSFSPLPCLGLLVFLLTLSPGLGGSRARAMSAKPLPCWNLQGNFVLSSHQLHALPLPLHKVSNSQSNRHESHLS